MPRNQSEKGPPPIPGASPAVMHMLRIDEDRATPLDDCHYRNLSPEDGEFYNDLSPEQLEDWGKTYQAWKRKHAKKQK